MSSQQDQVRLMAERIARRLAQSSNSGGGDAGPSSSQPGENGDVGHELATLRASLAEMQRRLAEVESQVKDEEREPVGPMTEARRAEEPSGPSLEGGPQTAAPRSTHSPWLSGIYVPATHPSAERFGVAEAAVSELVDFFEKEKTCSMEPGGKPCDHCAMCSSRGF